MQKKLATCLVFVVLALAACAAPRQTQPSAASSSAAEEPVHLIEQAKGSDGPTAPDSMNERIEQAADDYRQYAPVPRIALYDIAAPKDAEEYAAVDGYGVLLVSVVTQEKDEVPLKRVYVQIGGSTVDLQLYKAGFEKQSGSEKVQQVLGKYRWDGLYYYPIYFSVQAQAIVIDYAKNRSGFVIQRFDSGDQSLPDWLYPIAKAPSSPKPPAAAFTTLVAREYPGFFGKQ